MANILGHFYRRYNIIYIIIAVHDDRTVKTQCENRVTLDFEKKEDYTAGFTLICTRYVRILCIFFFLNVFTRYQVKGFLGPLTSSVVSGSKLDVVGAFGRSFFLLFLVIGKIPDENNENLWRSVSLFFFVILVNKSIEIS